VRSRQRRDRERRRAARAALPDQATAPAVEPDSAADTATPGDNALTTLAERWFVPLAVVILLVAAALRLPALEMNPFHHDEGVNGFFTTELVRHGQYSYNPQNFHGPSLYYFALASETVFGLNDVAMRLVPVLCGLLTVALMLPLRRYLGALATLSAAALFAVSPGAVYISRYFIHESLLVCFCMALFVASLLYRDTRRPAYLVAAAAAAALIFATKETGVIHIIVFVIAAVIANVYVTWRNPHAITGRAGERKRSARRAPRSLVVDGVEYRAIDRHDEDTRFSGNRIFGGFDIERLVAPAAVFLTIYVLLYSSFFTNFPKGLTDSLATFAIWTQTGGQTQVQPIPQYIVWMAAAEAPILVLGTIGGLIAAIRATDRAWVFIGLWALGVTAAYSLISYKTPWIALNMLLPLALLAGLTIDTIARSRRIPGHLVAPVALAAALGLATYQSIDLSYRHYADETYPYVFVHSTPEIFTLLGDIEHYSEKAGTGKDTGVVVVSPDYWPLPWYLRDYPKAGFYGEIVPTEEAMILANVNQEPDLGQYADRYTKTREYKLRPGVDLVLYVRKALAG
jgi:uncharacterized protein (TIGR03663 family)